eukprot:365327-Chlamydomonas_euryale.AAC.10
MRRLRRHADEGAAPRSPPPPPGTPAHVAVRRRHCTSRHARRSPLPLIPSLPLSLTFVAGSAASGRPRVSLFAHTDAAAGGRMRATTPREGGKCR